MREADKKRERLLNCRQKAAAAAASAAARGESKESRKIRDSNTTTLMLIVVITVSAVCTNTDFPIVRRVARWYIYFQTKNPDLG
jgi:hypothetical protein